jgi:hypothetical protein
MSDCFKFFGPVAGSRDPDFKLNGGEFIDKLSGYQRRILAYIFQNPLQTREVSLVTWKYCAFVHY